MLYVMVLLCTVSAYISMEKTGNMLALIRPTKAGWRRVKNWKMLIVVSFSMVCMLVVWIPDWIWIWKSYEVTEWNAALSWLFAFRDARIDITTGWYFAILIILRLFRGAMVGLLMLLVSEKSRSGMEAYGINALVFFVPAVLAVLGVPYVEQFSFSAILHGNVILRILIRAFG